MNLTPRTAFLICPMHTAEARHRSTELLRKIVVPAFDRFGFTIEHSLVQPPSTDETGIRGRMVDLIRKSDVCVADLTDNRPNVFFEYGWRRSTGRPVIALIQKGERIPYDVDDFHIVQYRVEEPAAAMREIEAFLRQRGFSSLDIEVAAERQDQVSKICEYIRRIQPERIDVLQLTCYRMVEELFDTLEKCANLTVRLLLMHPEAVSRYSLGPHHQEEVKGAERRIRKAAYQTVRAESPT